MRSKSILGTLLVTSALGLSLAGCRLDDRRLAAADTAWPATLAAPYPDAEQDRYGPPPQRIPVGRLASYDDTSVARIDKIWAPLEDSLAASSGYLLVTTDFRSPLDGHGI